MKRTVSISLSMLLAFSAIVVASMPQPAYATTDTYASSTSWTAPAGVTSVDVEAWGAGAGGDPCDSTTRGGPGGGGGAYSEKVGISVTPGNSYTVTVGIGGDDGLNGPDFCNTGSSLPTAGGDSIFQASTTVLAKGGSIPSGSTGGVGGAAASGVGDTKF